ncbi:Omega-amidase nit3 [Aspergillus melleus]|uniref:Omega-amidase nit3 n=1 Tax=Aspergillus melleus TaxID=138277 RepID=A0ACC3BCW1_9EURO|nr:Omega-amidase nit3 [Aspergillus melleus]
MLLPGSGILQKPLKVACIQIASGPSKAQNLAQARQKVLQAATAGASLIVLPECFNSPYSTAKFREYAEPLSTPPDPIASPSFTALAQMAQDTSTFIVGGSVPECDPSGKIYNTCAVYSPEGKLLASHRKMHLFDINIPNGMSFCESDTLAAGDNITVVDLEGYGRVGLGICYDMRFAELSTIAARQGAFALVFPSAFNTTTGPLHWELLGRARAVDNQVYTVLCSQSRGAGSSYPAWGYSMVSDPMGRIVAGTGEGEDIVYATLEPEVIEEARLAIPITVQRRHDVYPDIGQLVRTEW